MVAVGVQSYRVAGTLGGDMRLRPEGVLGGWLSATQSGGVLQAEQGWACPPREEEGQALQTEANRASYWDRGTRQRNKNPPTGRCTFFLPILDRRSSSFSVHSSPLAAHPLAGPPFQPRLSEPPSPGPCPWGSRSGCDAGLTTPQGSSAV